MSPFGAGVCLPSRVEQLYYDRKGNCYGKSTKTAAVTGIGSYAWMQKE